ncbi:MAG TPA: cytochrome c biogenesis protein CcsA [Bacillota bacterium]
MRLLAVASLIAVPVSLYMAFLYAPTEAFMGDVQRIMYVHVASAETAYLALFFVFAASIAYLRSRRPHWDALAVAGAEVGVLFTTATLATGSIWARQVWGWWWTWDPRLTTTLVLWMLYVVYLLVRRGIDDPDRRARFAAVLGILAFADVPIVHLSVTWWRSIHPPSIAPGGTELHPDMSIALMVAMVAFTLLGALLVWMRYRLEWLLRVLERVRAARLDAV